ncbi:purine-nucleoside phosphorylase [Qiania dongpingensis]|uniref:Purine nucleoside phosphorylase DeoD-type n=1 Tax=Qiania dongpingensis TaxID=2763669 RepID=A0A7G9G4X7_9FIRM|nr:purine-nucleoside phosphorylase [Qiania dongpingensis]QNM05859.1 purine-nucleoside phosphorylase [Qiania dongpingensis]
MATPHNQAETGEIAESILLPGDPLRAKFIAENFLEDVEEFNSVRNMLGFTGNYQGKRVSVMGTGMGCPSIGIYSYELIHFYGVKNLIRVGSCGSVQEHVRVGDIVMAMGASTDGGYAHQYKLPGTYSATASYELLARAVQSASEHGFSHVEGNILSSDLFYTETPEWKEWAKMGILSIEMESYALYCNANRAGVRALGIFTVSDSIVTGESLPAKERQVGFTNMMQVALETAVSFTE